MAKNTSNSLNSRLVNSNELIAFLNSSLSTNKEDSERIIHLVKNLFNDQFNQNSQETLRELVFLIKFHLKYDSTMIYLYKKISVIYSGLIQKVTSR